jgi:hypothetical protein
MPFNTKKVCIGHSCVIVSLKTIQVINIKTKFQAHCDPDINNFDDLCSFLTPYLPLITIIRGNLESKRKTTRDELFKIIHCLFDAIEDATEEPCPLANSYQLIIKNVYNNNNKNNNNQKGKGKSIKNPNFKSRNYQRLVKTTSHQRSSRPEETSGGGENEDWLTSDMLMNSNKCVKFNNLANGGSGGPRVEMTTIGVTKCADHTMLRLDFQDCIYFYSHPMTSPRTFTSTTRTRRAPTTRKSAQPRASSSPTLNTQKSGQVKGYKSQNSE